MSLSRKQNAVWVGLAAALLGAAAWFNLRSADPRATPQNVQPVAVVQEPRSNWPTLPPRVTTQALADFVCADPHDTAAHTHKNRITPDQTLRLPRIEAATDIQAVLRVLRDAGEDDTIRHEAAELLRRSSYHGLIDEMKRIIGASNEKERFRSWAVQHIYLQAELLGDFVQHDACDYFFTLLKDRHTAVRAESLLAMCRMGDARVEVTAKHWLDTPADASVHYIAVRCLYECGAREGIPALRRALENPDEQTVVNAMDALSSWNDQESKSFFQKAQLSPNPRIKRAAEFAVKRLDGEYLSSTPPTRPLRPQKKKDISDF